MRAAGAELSREAVNARLIALMASGAIAFGVFLSGFVLREPAPYELFMALLIAVWALFGLTISRAVAPLLALLILFNIGGMISMTQMAELRDTPLYLSVSLFLALTGVFFAAVVEKQWALMRIIFLAWTVAATVTSVVGILGYFNAFPGSEAFTLYGRAAGVFKDPNVFGAYIVPPAIFLLHRMLMRPPHRILLYLLPFLVICAGLLLAFSRGAWGLFVFCAILLAAALFLQSNSVLFRMRLALMALAAMVFTVLAIVIVLQLPGVAELFSARAQLVQEYDASRLGRFARHFIGFQMAMENPFGIGPLVFGRLYGEDTHNIWLKALLDYSWLGFAVYLTLIVWTLAGGFRILFRDRPWQPYLLCAWIALLGHVFLGAVIDTNHWRHFYILLGMVWGAMALERRHQSGLAAASRGASPAAGGYTMKSPSPSSAMVRPTTNRISVPPSTKNELPAPSSNPMPPEGSKLAKPKSLMSILSLPGVKS